MIWRIDSTLLGSHFVGVSQCSSARTPQRAMWLRSAKPVSGVEHPDGSPCESATLNSRLMMTLVTESSKVPVARRLSLSTFAQGCATTRGAAHSA